MNDITLGSDNLWWWRKEMNDIDDTVIDYKYCKELIDSLRGKYIIAKALYLAHQSLNSETDDRKKQPSDMYDMMCLLQVGYPNFYGTFLECEKRGIQI